MVVVVAASPHLSISAARELLPGFRAAVYLNNAGVTLLEKGCYRQAVETLQDAIAVMKDAFQQPHDDGGRFADTGTKAPLLSYEDKLLKSSLRSQTPEVAAASSGKRVTVHSLSYDGSGFSPDVLIHLHESPAMTCFFPVRIDVSAIDWRRDMTIREGRGEGGASGDHRNHPSSEMDHEAAILLYNFGVANLLLSEASTSSMSPTVSAESIARLRSCAVSVFQLSSSIVSRCAQTCTDRVEEADLLQITLLVFHATIQVLVYSGNDEEAIAVFDRYESVRRAVEALHSSPWYSIPKSIAAAA